MISVYRSPVFRSLWLICYALLCFIINVSPKESKESLPFCGLVELSNKYIFVSTLDGKLTALNSEQGTVVWSVQVGTESLLSCSIHKLELTNYGHLVRMIPSLNGGLYKFNGESIEAIPVTVEHLLQASFKYSDDLVISGGKESQTFGVALHSGKILYECSMKGCGNSSHSNDVGDILVIQRLGQTVRAIEPRTGSERWNFSVAQHNLKLLSECHGNDLNEQNFLLKVIVPEGLICAIDSKDQNKILWQHRFTSPIVNAWQIRRGKLFAIDLFSSFQPEKIDMVISPTLYIGMHEKQLYIQESVLMERRRQELSTKFGQNLISNENSALSIPWKPVSASRKIGGFLEGEIYENVDEVSQRQTTALSVLYASPYVDGSGFYLYDEGGSGESKVDPYEKTVIVDDGNELEMNVGYEIEDIVEETPVEIVIVSLWYWWKEVVAISLTTAVLFNVFTRRFFVRRPKNYGPELDDRKQSSHATSSDSGVDVNSEKSSEISDLKSQEFVSRYLTDFEPVDCLGKGGFGVVFEAKNKIDDCHYAIKRIVLPVSEDSRDRVMREVKALAKLDHHHIVRYFNAWTECPPPGWQEDHDKMWIDSMDISLGTDVTSNKNYIPASTGNSSFGFNPMSLCYKNSTFEVDTNKYSLSSGSNDSYIVFEGDNVESESRSRSMVESSNPHGFLSKGSDKKTIDRPSKISKSNALAFSERTCALTCNTNKVYLYIQMQLCQRQSLRDWLTSNSEREYSHVLRIFEQILQAVEHVHLQGLIHRDLKPSNIFFSLDNEIKIGDFGLVTAMTEGDKQMSPCDCSKALMENERHTAQVGTQLYMSPEQLSGKRYNYKVDIYSLGLILFELLVPFNTQMERIRVLEDIKSDKFSEGFIKKYKTEHELLRLMLSHSPDERPTTYGIRARLPLKQDTNEQCWHFDLPKRRRMSSKTSSTSRSSSEGSAE